MTPRTWSERKQAAFAELLALFEDSDGLIAEAEDRGACNGFFDCYCLLTGQDTEAVHEAVQAALQARHEQAVMEEA